jgi:hypothetical protein
MKVLEMSYSRVRSFLGMKIEILIKKFKFLYLHYNVTNRAYFTIVTINVRNPHIE